MTTGPIPLIVRRMIAAPRDRIFDLFCSADALSKWFTPSTEIALQVVAFDFSVGGRFRFRYILPDGSKPVVSGVYQQIEAPDLITCSWVWEAPDPLAGIPMRVCFEFFANSGETEVVITHHGIPSDQACSIHEDGWEGALNGLQRFAGTTDWKECHDERDAEA